MIFRKEQQNFSNADVNETQLSHVRRLTLYLIASGSTNIVLMAILLYSTLGGNFGLSRPQITGRLWQGRDVAIADDRTNIDILRSLVHMLPEQLVAQLDDHQLVEDGYFQRDLALGCLVSLHHLDLSKALRGTRVPAERIVDVDLDRRIQMYPGLSEGQYEQIIAFVNTERWPLTSQGLYLALQQPKLREDPSLSEAFYLTPEFLTLQRLFGRAEALIDRSELLDVLLQGDWATLENFYQACQEVGETSPSLRRRLCVSYILSGVRSASYLMLKADGQFAAKKLDDGTVLAMLKSMDVVTPEVEAFVSELVRSPRSDVVLEQAQRLCSTALVAAVKQIEEKEVIKQPVAARVYVVQRGDSLWKISRQHKVDVGLLKAYNGLQGDLLKPGATLRIP